MTEMERYKEELIKEWTTDSRMIDHCLKRAEEVVLIKDKVLVVEKQKMKTTFCFGYGNYGRSTDEEEREVSNLEEAYRTNQEYFIEENTKDLKRAIKEISEHSVYIAPYFRDSEIYYWDYLYSYEKLEDVNIEKALLINNEEKQKLLDAYKRALAKKKKRVDVYLKKYGLSKLNTWMYLVD